MLEVKALLMTASGSAFVNFDDILVDLKLTPSVLDIVAPRYCISFVNVQPPISVSIIHTLQILRRSLNCIAAKSGG
jgi:hypothetical protein